MDLAALSALVAVVDCGSISGASRLLDVSRATVRRRLDELAAQIGLPLITQHGPSARATEAGALLVARARKVLADVEQMMQSVQARAERPEGLLRMVVPVGLHPAMALAGLSLVRSSWPGVELDIRMHEDPLSCLDSGVELVVSFSRTLPSGPWEVLELSPMQEHLFAAQSYLEQHGTIDCEDDLAGHTLLIWRPPDGPANVLPTRDGGELPIRPSVVSGDVHLIHSLAREGRGIAYAPDAGVVAPAYEVDASTPMVTLLAERIGRPRPVRLLFPAGLAAVPKLRAVLDVVRSVDASVRQHALVEQVNRRRS